MEEARACQAWRVWLCIGAAGFLLFGAAPAAVSAHDGNTIESLRQELERERQARLALERRLTELEQNAGRPDADEPLEQRVSELEHSVHSRHVRFDDLETQVIDIDDRVGERSVVHGFDSVSMDIGGFLTQTFAAGIGQDSSRVSFNQTLFELLAGVQVTDDVSFFTALGWLRESDLSVADRKRPRFRNFENRVPQIIAWADYRHSDSLQFQIGRFITPHGIINIEHFPPVLLDINQPQFLRPFSGATIFPNFVSGTQLHGKFFLGEQGQDVLQYNTYVGMFSAGDTSNVITGGRLGYTLGQSGFTLGGNFSHGRRKAGSGKLGNFSIVGSKSLTTNNYDTFGADLLYDKGRLLWKNEIFYSLEHGEDNRLAFYTQPAWRLSDRWIAFYRFDYLDAGQGLPKSIEHVVGLNYLPYPTIRLRAAYLLKRFAHPTTNAGLFQLSATVSF